MFEITHNCAPYAIGPNDSAHTIGDGTWIIRGYIGASGTVAGEWFFTSVGEIRAYLTYLDADSDTYETILDAADITATHFDSERTTLNVRDFFIVKVGA
jgi:hypothetical protein